jgi:hypothetical protein
MKRHKMARGQAEIPTLRLEVLQEFVTSFMAPPNLILSGMFPSRNADSATIKWESQRGGRGMTPFVPPGAPAPLSAGYGIAEHQATAAYWKEKRYFDEEFLNNLRKPGTSATYQAAADTLADAMRDITNRAYRRKEYMFSQMMFTGALTYQLKGGVKFTVDYGIPSDHLVTLGSSYYWNTGGSKDILGDIKTGKRKIAETVGSHVTHAICNSKVLDMIGKDSALRALLQKNAFGDGGLMGGGNVDSLALVNARVIGRLLDIDNLIVYDEMYEIKALLTAAVTAGSTTWLTVDDASDFEAYENLRVTDLTDGSYEDRYILQVNKAANTIQIEYPFSNSYMAGEDYVTMQKYFIPDDKFAMFASTVDGMPIARYMKAPYGLNRIWGLKVDKKEEWDPEGVFVRVQDKGLPVLMHPSAMYVLDVTATEGQSATSTTTTSSTTTTTTTTAA